MIVSIEVRNLEHSYGSKRVLFDISFSVDKAKVLCILGPSGSGKSSLLRILAGLEQVQQGEILLDGLLCASSRDSPPPETRPIGLVFQDHALFPHLTASENIAFGLAQLSKKQRAEVSREALISVGLPDVGQRYPHALSGGEQQRVALARALATKPKVMLMDEPFASVDAPLRRRLREDARTSLKDSETATVIVTHDTEEAIVMADEIMVLVEGRCVQLGTPFELCENPTHPFTAETISKREMIFGRLEENRVITAFGSINLREGSRRPFRETQDLHNVIIALVPSTLNLSLSQKGVLIEDIRFELTHWSATLGDNQHRLKVHLPQNHQFKPGDKVTVDFADCDYILY